MGKSIFITIIFLIVIAISIGLIFPSFQKFKELSITIQQKEKELRELEDYVSHLQKISLQFKEFEPQLSKIDQALMEDSYLPNFFDFCQKKSAENGLNIEKITIAGSTSLKEREDIKERTIELKLSGPYPNFKNFLIALEKSARLIEVNSIFFSTKSQKEPPKFDLIVKIYSY